MRFAVRLAALSCVWLLGCTMTPAQDAGPRAGGSQGLHSCNEQELLEYLSDHSVPYIANEGAGNAPPLTDPMFQDQVKRALELFKSGSPRLRLAIAKALTWVFHPEAAAFWEACGPNDAEAQHYILGIALANAPDGEKQTLRQWLLERADVKYAPALLKNLHGGDLFSGTDASEQEEILDFLKRLYKQQGVVVRYKGADEETTISGSVQQYVVALLPKTKPGWDLLLEWMAADARTADQGTLREMWGQWQHMAQLDLREHPEIVQLCETTAHSSALAESWCLSPKRTPFPNKFGTLKSTFEENVWRQVFSDDERVRRSIITSLLQGSGAWDKTQTPGFLRGLDIPARARTQAVAEAREIYGQLGTLDQYAEGERARTWLDERFQALNVALLPN